MRGYAFTEQARRSLAEDPNRDRVIARVKAIGAVTCSG
jgi:hypothetical protein